MDGAREDQRRVADYGGADDAVAGGKGSARGEVSTVLPQFGELRGVGELRSKGEVGGSATRAGRAC